MNDSTTEKKSPKEETLQLLRAFARLYRPQSYSVEADRESQEDFNTLPIGIC